MAVRAGPLAEARYESPGRRQCRDEGEAEFISNSLISWQKQNYSGIEKKRRESESKSVNMQMRQVKGDYGLSCQRILMHEGSQKQPHLGD